MGILTRLWCFGGGGSAEDLSAFNDERLVRCVHAAKTPIVSAIGHEIDYTLIDFVSDFRAPTPTAAAQHLVDDFKHLRSNFAISFDRIGLSLRGKVEDFRLDTANATEQATLTITKQVEDIRHKLALLGSRAEAANPLHRLMQGYSLSRLASTKEPIVKIDQLQINDTVTTDVSDGSFESIVTGTKKHEY